MRNTEVTVLAKLRLRPDCIEPGLRDLLRFARTVKRHEKDCRAIDIIQDLDDPAQVTMVERWTDRAAYEGPHLQTEHMKAFIEGSGKYFEGSAGIAFGRALLSSSDDRRGVAPYGR